MVPGDASKVQVLMFRCYGESYFDDLYYDVEALRLAVSEKNQYSAIAELSSGEIVAHIGLRHYMGGLTADSTMGIIDPRYREQGLLVQVGVALMPVYEQLNLCGLYLYAVTIHPYSQKASLKGGSGVTGIFLNYIPQGTNFLEIESGPSTESTPALVMLQPFTAAPVRKIYLPKRYKEVVVQAFEQCGIKREYIENSAVNRMPSISSIRVVIKQRQRICYLWVDEMGEDFGEQIEQKIKMLNEAELNAIYLQMPMDSVLIDRGISAVSRQGFFYAGVLPEHGNRDWLTLQKIDKDTLDLSNVKLANEHCYRLLDYMLRDQ